MADTVGTAGAEATRRGGADTDGTAGFTIGQAAVFIGQFTITGQAVVITTGQEGAVITGRAVADITGQAAADITGQAAVEVIAVVAAAVISAARGG